VPAYKVPRCDGYVWTRRASDASLDAALAFLVEHGHYPPRSEVDMGEGHSCGSLASFLVTYQNSAFGPMTSGACSAHVMEMIESGMRYKASQARYYRDLTVPAPRVERLVITPDTRAAAHGRTRYLVTKEPVAEPMQLALVAPSGALPAVPPRRDRTPKQASPDRAAEDEWTLF
jgi:hypothetical protein